MKMSIIISYVVARRIHLISSCLLLDGATKPYGHQQMTCAHGNHACFCVCVWKVEMFFSSYCSILKGHNGKYPLKILGANIRRLFTFPNGHSKNYPSDFTTFVPSWKPFVTPMKKRLLFFLLSLNLWALSAQNSLCYRLEKGQSFTIHQTAIQYITQELSTGSQVITNDIHSKMKFTILGVTDSVYNISIEFKDLKMDMKSDLYGKLMQVDALELDENDVQSRIFHSLIGAKVLMKMTPTGDVLEVDGGEELVKTMVDAAGIEDDFTRKLLSTSLQKEFGSEALSKSYEQMTFFYPVDPVVEGDSWQTQFNGKLSANNRWTLSNHSDEISEISGEAEANLDVVDAQTTMKLKGTQTSKLTVNSKNGLLQDLVVIGTYTGYSILAQLGNEQIPTSIEMKLTYELIQ